MRFFFFSSYLHEIVPEPDDRIHCIYIGLMTPRELAEAKRNASGRFYFGFIVAVFVAFAIMIFSSSHIHQQDERADLPMYALMIASSIVAVLRIAFVFWKKTTCYSLIENELERRKFDKAGKYC